MTVNLTGALGAYRQAAESASRPGLAPRTGAPGKSFGALMSEVSETMLKTGAEADRLTAKAMTGKADLNQVVMAVSNADLALQTVVAVRDKVIQAYQDILRMPI